jgi:hypothetical protein
LTQLLVSLASVFLVIAVGVASRRFALLDDQAWRGFEAVTYHLLFPAVIIHTLAFASLGGLDVLPMAGALMGAILLMAGLTLMLRPWLAARGVDGPAFTSVFQGAARWNTFIALALASAQFGAAGVALMAVAIAAMIPLLNLLSVLILSRYAGGRGQTVGATLLTLAKNPFVWSCAAGLALHPVAAFVPGPVSGALDIMGKAALAAGLLVVGAGLDLGRLARPRLPHLVAAGLKLMVMPALVGGLAVAFGAAPLAISVAVIAAAVPTATASYILARQMGGDAPLMAEIVTLQTLAAMVTLPTVMLLAL